MATKHHWKSNAGKHNMSDFKLQMMPTAFPNWAKKKKSLLVM